MTLHEGNLLFAPSIVNCFPVVNLPYLHREIPTLFWSHLTLAADPAASVLPPP